MNAKGFTMKKRNLFASLLLALLSMSCVTGTASEVSLDSLLKEMVDRSELTRQCRPKYAAKAVTSYDRASELNNFADGLYIEKNGRDWGKGWFANRDFKQFVRVEKKNGRTENVLMEDKS